MKLPDWSCAALFLTPYSAKYPMWGGSGWSVRDGRARVTELASGRLGLRLARSEILGSKRYGGRTGPDGYVPKGIANALICVREQILVNNVLLQTSFHHRNASSSFNLSSIALDSCCEADGDSSYSIASMPCQHALL
eukprot:1147564-Pelagomonas_calceolata.AAC.4